MKNKGLKDQFLLTDHHAPIVSRQLGETIRKYVEDGLLAGQENYSGNLKGVRILATRDPLLSDVKRLMPTWAPVVRSRYYYDASSSDPGDNPKADQKEESR